MNRYRQTYTFLLLLVLSLTGRSQPDDYTRDTTEIVATFDTIMKLSKVDPDSALQLSRSNLARAEKVGFKRGTASSHRWVAHLQGLFGNYEIAISHFEAAKKIYQEMGLVGDEATVENSLGFAYQNSGRIEEAVRHLNRALELYERLEEPSEIASTYINLGAIHESLGQYEEAESAYARAIEQARLSGNTASIATGYNNIAAMHYSLGNIDSTIQYFKKALRLYESVEDIAGISSVYTNLGYVYSEEGLIDSAEQMYQRAIDLHTEKIDPENHGMLWVNYSMFLFEQDRLQEAKKAIEHAWEILEPLNNPEQVIYAAYQYHMVLREMGDYKSAYEMYKLSEEMEDSIDNESVKNAALKERYAYEYKKKQLADSLEFQNRTRLQNAKLESEELENEKKSLIIYVSAGGLVILFLFGGLMYRRFRVTNKQKQVIEHQKDVVDEKNKEILDSIKYAKRIQAAILPPLARIQEAFPRSFVLYKPKDIVAGDFYWMETYAEASASEGWTYIAAADCTGHGVPGAMVSVVCNNGLNRAVREHGLTDPGKILDKARQIVIEEFKKSEEDVKDGMDIALIRVQHKNDRTVELKYAGAHNPLWILRADEDEIEEIKANKIPIGRYAVSEPFKTHDVALTKGDRVYMFSDGFVDQFGGPKGKKLKAANFKKLLTEYRDQPIEQQGEFLDRQFEQWRGELEQIDDVCVIGIEI